MQNNIVAADAWQRGCCKELNRDEFLSRIFQFMNIEELLVCDTICLRWHCLVRKMDTWRSFCLEHWNFPCAYGSLCKNEECLCICNTLRKKGQFRPSSPFVKQFVGRFKTYCGGGENELYFKQVAGDQLIDKCKRFQELKALEEAFNYAKDEDDDNDSSSDDEDDTMMGPVNQQELQQLHKMSGQVDRLIDPNDCYKQEQQQQFKDLPIESKPLTVGVIGIDDNVTDCEQKPKKPVFCHLDMHALTSTCEKTITCDEQITSLQELWLFSLHQQLRGIHTTITREDILNLDLYLKLFFVLFERTSLRIHRDEDFLYAVYNTVKKVSIFIRVLSIKTTYVLSFEQKNIWQEFLSMIYAFWTNIVKTRAPLFDRVNNIADVLMREFFGNYKPAALVSCFEIYHTFALAKPIKSAVPEEMDLYANNALNNICGTLMYKYTLMVQKLLAENVCLIALKPSVEHQFNHFYYLFGALKQDETIMQSSIFRVCPAQTVVQKTRAQLLTRWLDLTATFCKFVRALYDSYDVRNAPKRVKKSQFQKFTSVPLELQNAFHDLNLETNTQASLKFSLFMYEYKVLIFRIVQIINNQLEPLAHNDHAKRRVKVFVQQQAAKKRQRNVLFEEQLADQVQVQAASSSSSNSASNSNSSNSGNAGLNDGNNIWEIGGITLSKRLRREPQA